MVPQELFQHHPEIFSLVTDLDCASQAIIIPIGKTSLFNKI